MTYEKATEIMTNWLNNGHEGMTGERLGYIEGWFHEEDKEAFELAIEALHFMNNHKVVLFAENMTEEEKQKLVAEFKAVMDNAKFTVGSEIPQGEWIKDNSGDRFCSVCGKSALYHEIGLMIESRFCPNCGAAMKIKNISPDSGIREFDKKFADLIVFNDQPQRQLKSSDVHEDV